MTASLYGPAFFEGRSATVSLSAAAVVPHLMHLLNPKSVLDVGCGQGEWLDLFPVNDKIGVDIAAPERKGFAQRDLTEFMYVGRYDLVLCLEVGEHLPEDAADTLVDTLVRAVNPGGAVVFGAAVPGQEGIGHINCQSHEYWHEKFAERGYAMEDILRPLIRDDARVSPWYRNNCFLYRAAA